MKKQELSFFETPVSAGFTSPANDPLSQKLDLNDYLIRNRTSTFFVRVQGDSMIGAGIQSGDMLIVDRSLQARSNQIVIAVLDSEFTVKRIKYGKNCVYLLPENPKYPEIKVTQNRDFQVWGVVTFVIHKAK